MKCPTCTDAKENCCCYCGMEIPDNLQKLAPDPYASEINDNHEKHLQCASCYSNSCDEI